jgi:hypothetical protein
LALGSSEIDVPSDISIRRASLEPVDSNPILADVTPGSGLLLVQILMASIAGTGFFLRKTWRRIGRFFGRRPPPEPASAKVDKHQQL